jgi:hypothetical protein
MFFSVAGLYSADTISGHGSAIDFWKRPGKWVAGDLHTHTYLTDGSHTQEDVLGHAFDKYGLDWMANSEHGGKFGRDPEGASWPAGTVFLGDPGAGNMWRWQTLRDYSYPLIQDFRMDYPEKLIIQGYEWNVPGHEHASVAIVGRVENNGLPIAQHEYLFDASDSGITSGTHLKLKKVTKNTTNNHDKAVEGAAWLQKYYPRTSWFILNHPSRKLKYSIAHIRDLNNAAPDVCFGLEGIPGHQKEPFRGGYDNGPFTDPVTGEDITYKARTYGGADYMIARTGGLWDALLGEGRKFWTFVNSDFHSSADDADFWPGEYAKTHVFVSNPTPEDLVNGLRSGNSFSVHGDLINSLDFYARKTTAKATMGQSLRVKIGSTISVAIRFKTPDSNNCNPEKYNCVKPEVDHVDLIQGAVTGLIPPGDPNYGKDTNDSTTVMARFDRSDFDRIDGWYTKLYTISNIQNSMYLRLRGTNQPIENLDVNGDAFMDVDPVSEGLCRSGQEEFCSNGEKAFADLWFYSNPIFVNVF